MVSLNDEEMGSPVVHSYAALRDDDASSSPKSSGVEEQPPYSLRNEVRFFFAKGLPLGLSSFLEWGIPPLFSMIMAGHTTNSAELQEALGYARVFFNITILMPMFGMFAYFATVVPGSLGAGRKDRLPVYFRRSMLIELVLLFPMLALQFCSGPIMEGLLGASPRIAAQVEAYTRLMVVTSLLLLLECHVEFMLINIGYARSATLNSFLTGLGIDVVCTWVFIYHFELGIHGAAYTQIVVKASRLVVWACVLSWYGLWRELFVTESREALLSWREWRVFCRLSFPSVLSNFSGWLIFEMQLMCLARIGGIEDAAVAAGAVWVTMESTLAAVQDGWIKVCSMRTLVLLGRVDPGAGRSYVVLCALSALVVLLTNVPMLVFSDAIAAAMSSDAEVQEWLAKIIWVLAMQSQIRISAIEAQFLLIPIGRPWAKIIATFISFYLIAAPISGVLALTDVATTLVAPKIVVCVACTSIGMGVLGVWGFWFMARLDWEETGRVIAARANTDKEAAGGAGGGDGGGGGGGDAEGQHQRQADRGASRAEDVPSCETVLERLG